MALLRVVFVLVCCLVTQTLARLDLFHFEEVVLPKYIDAFTLDFYSGTFSYKPAASDQNASIYGISDMLHTLYTVGQIPVFLPNASIIASWVDQIHSFQNASGFYKLGSSTPGYQPWHSTACMLVCPS